MSDNGYDEDFEDYDEDFESDNDLEVPPQQDEASGSSPVSIAGLATDAWPSLAAGQPPLKGAQQRAKPATFTRSLFGGPSAAFSHLEQQQFLQADHSSSATISPAPPPLTDSQRSRASKALTRALELQQQRKLSLSPQLQLLVLQPLSQYQQYAQGVGAYAHVRVGSCQTRQLDQEVHEQDMQTEEIEVDSCSCQVPDDTFTSHTDCNPFSSSNCTANSSSSSASAKAAGSARSAAAAARLLKQDAALAEFLDWAVPEMVFELGKAAADAAPAAEGSRAAAACQGLTFGPCSFQNKFTGSNSSLATSKRGAASSSSCASSSSVGELCTGELQLWQNSMLTGRTVIGLACPPTPADAAAAAAAISTACTAAAAGVSAHLLLSCCSPVAMSPEAALKEHGIPGMGCLCVWDLKAQQQQQQQQQSTGYAAMAAAGGLVQLLVSEGRPSCCCWGTGAAGTLVFAGMEEGGLCCWDLAEPDSAHQRQQQQQGSTALQRPVLPVPPPRRPSYSTELPLLSNSFSSDSSVAASNGLAAGVHSPAGGVADVGGIVAVAVLPPPGARAAGGAARSSWGGSVCQIVSLSASGAVSMYSVMLGAAGGMAGQLGATAAAADLGTRSGSRVWLARTFVGLPLGHVAAKPLHLRMSGAAVSGSGNAIGCMHAAALATLPGVGQQLLVGSSRGRVLKGACLGTPAPPREYIADEWQLAQAFKASSDTHDGADTASMPDAEAARSSSCLGVRSSSSSVFGSVVSLSVCPLCPEAWLAGHSCGSVALYSGARSRPVLLWPQLHGAGVVAARWVPLQPVSFLVLHADGCLLSFNLQLNTHQAVASVDLARRAVAVGHAALPHCMEVLVSSASSTAANQRVDGSSSSSSNGSRSLRLRGTTSSQSTHRGGTATAGDTAAGARYAIAVGYDDGSTMVYQMSAEWSNAATGQQQQQQQLGQEQQLGILQQLLATY